MEPQHLRSIHVDVTDPTQVGVVRRLGVSIAARIGLDGAAQSNLAIVLTELAGNLVKHAQGGEILLRAIHADHGPAIEALALDKGQGMADIGKCMRDGYSTAGSPGTGLGAITRLSDRFDIYSAEGAGTAIMCQVAGTKGPPSQVELDFGVVSVALAGQIVSGDGWAVEHLREKSIIMVVDGLGHGSIAAEAAAEAMRVFRLRPDLELSQQMELIDAALRKTRGAAVALAEISKSNRLVRYTGVGNISGIIENSQQRRAMISHNGTVGHQVHKIQEFTYPWPAGSSIILSSDGLGTRWGLAEYPGLWRKAPSLIAGVLYRDHRRPKDDVTVMVVKEA